jgi:hypothetical protein
MCIYEFSKRVKKFYGFSTEKTRLTHLFSRKIIIFLLEKLSWLFQNFELGKKGEKLKRNSIKMVE